ncbi:glycerol-3-phosphate phosphatase-like [Rhopilema esculentum]|uniref:glycerol-3-phosphate phosphatase-like n=1 Tax=Rhopilema esculentum TaxID=499914 RepID=UPI0031DAF661|eukprot:gene11381-21576_t
MACRRLDRKLGKELIQSVNSVLFDCDGVIWHPTGQIEGAASLVASLRNLGKRVVFVTNNNTKSIRQLAEKFEKFGIEANQNEIFGTARVAAVYLKHVLKLEKKVFIVGGEGIAEEVRNVGLEHLPIGACPLPGDPSLEVTQRVDLSTNSEVGAVVVGFDEHISFQKIASAMTYLEDPNVHFIATNTDNQFPMGDGTFMPGSGVMVAAVQRASKRDPIIMGKPEKPMIDSIEAIHNIEPSKTLMIGDRLETDIAFGKRSGMKTLAVLSGVVSLNELEKLKLENDTSDLIPDFFADSVKDLLDSILEN